mmetsp:Transcript_30614/g.46211  ORF Transcript_30614/g.46211 Transcript_30614/m.46211 type:complete len:323 (-) Transcript_30614:305-1273(-)
MPRHAKRCSREILSPSTMPSMIGSEMSRTSSPLPMMAEKSREMSSLESFTVSEAFSGTGAFPPFFSAASSASNHCFTSSVSSASPFPIMALIPPTGGATMVGPAAFGVAAARAEGEEGAATGAAGVAASEVVGGAASSSPSMDAGSMGSGSASVSIGVPFKELPAAGVSAGSPAVASVAAAPPSSPLPLLLLLSSSAFSPPSAAAASTAPSSAAEPATAAAVSSALPSAAGAAAAAAAASATRLISASADSKKLQRSSSDTTGPKRDFCSIPFNLRLCLITRPAFFLSFSSSFFFLLFAASRKRLDKFRARPTRASILPRER